MNNPLQATYYADDATQHRVDVLENVQLARDTYRLRFHCPALAAKTLPGQFLMVRLAGFDDPLIGRPLALYDSILDEAQRPSAVDVVYVVKGKFTSRLVRLSPGQQVEVWGPLGNGFIPRPADHLIMVAGGIGQTPFVALAQEALGQRQYGDPPRQAATVGRVTLCYGARSADLLAGVEDFERIGVELRLATDDGSRGHRGLVTELLEDCLQDADTLPEVVCCGPEAMMESVSRITLSREVPCRLSLETPMACGVGICFTCVARVRDTEKGWDYKRTCVEGPVFDAADIVWD